VITGDQAIALLIEANPVPDISTLDVSGELLATRLADLDPRGSEMTTTESDRFNMRPASGRRWLIGIAAAISALVMAGILLFQATDDSPVADQPTTPVEVATAFVDAWTSFDADAAAGYLSNDALTEFGGSINEMRLAARMNQAQGKKWSLTGCELSKSSAPAGTSVRCPYEFHGLGSELIGRGPYPGSFLITVSDDGAIVRVSDRFLRSHYAREVLQPFASWVRDVYPAHLTLLWTDVTDANLIDVAVLSEESIRLWEQHRQEWAKQSERFLTLTYPPSNQGGLPPDGAVPSAPTVGEVVADLGLFHEGWAFVYADGRAIWSADGLDILELQLTAEGLDLVRSGDLPLETFFDLDSVPASVVEDRQIKLFVPPTYAVCGFSGDAGPAGAEYAASQNVDLLPGSAQALLAGKEQTITTRIPFEPDGLSYSECHELTLADARAFLEILEAEKTVEVMPNGMRTDPYWILMTWNGIDFGFHPILPHGQVINFPG
jgi:hypothetical protein